MPPLLATVTPRIERASRASQYVRRAYLTTITVIVFDLTEALLDMGSAIQILYLPGLVRSYTWLTFTWSVKDWPGCKYVPGTLPPIIVNPLPPVGFGSGVREGGNPRASTTWR
ncbi:MAG: hypothetical protein ACRD22_19060 [Terriglobia bacterium]